MCFLKLEVILYCTFAVKAGVKKSGKLTPWASQEVWDDVGRCLGGCPVCWMMFGDHVFPDFFTPAFTANVL